MHLVLWCSFQLRSSTALLIGECFNAPRALVFLPTYNVGQIVLVCNVSMHLVLWCSFLRSTRNLAELHCIVSMHLVLWCSFQQKRYPYQNSRGCVSMHLVLWCSFQQGSPSKAL